MANFKEVTTYRNGNQEVIKVPVPELSKKNNTLQNHYRHGNNYLSTNLKDKRLWTEIYGNLTGTEVTNYKSWAYACINARAENVMLGTVLLYKMINYSRRLKEIFEHPFLDIVNRTNLQGLSFQDLLFITSVSMDLEKKGAFWYAPKDKAGRPIDFYFLPSSNMSIKLDQSGIFIESFIYNDKGREITYSPDEIIWFKIPYYKNPYISKPTASACQVALNIDEFMGKYQEKYYNTGSSFSDIFSTDEILDDSSHERVLGELQEKFYGYENAGDPMLLEGGVKPVEIKTTPREMDYVKSDEANRDKILAIFKVPKTILGITDDVNRANSHATQRAFINRTIIPFTKFILNPLSMFIKKNYDSRIITKFDYSLGMDFAEQIEYTKMALTHGLNSRNEMREAFNYEASSQPEADLLIIPSGKAAADPKPEEGSNPENNPEDKGNKEDNQ